MPLPYPPCVACGQDRAKPSAVACPNCRKSYIPALGARCGRGHLIQQEFPRATPIQREQLQTGLCSDTCWNAFLGADPGRD